MNPIFKWLIIPASLICSEVQADECVIVLHGLAKSHASMMKLSKALDQSGYYTINVDYPSTTLSIEQLADTTISEALAKCPDNAKIHFVTHSMGGILVRQYLSKNTINNLGRVVMLGPPNKGSQVVDTFLKVSDFEWLIGPAGSQLSTGEHSLPNSLGPANFEVGIIAGTRSLNPILSTMLPDKDDGKVAVENTKLEGMMDHLSLPVTHPFMMKNQGVIEQVQYFLRNGAFDKERI